MSRRTALKTLGAGGLAVLLQPCVAKARTGDDRGTSVGPLELKSIPAVDAHIHPPSDRTVSQMVPFWGRFFAGSADAAGGDFRNEPSASLSGAYSGLFRRLPLSVGLRNYVARSYGVTPSDAAVDDVMAKHQGAGFTQYYRRKMDDERISAVVVQSSDIIPNRPRTLLPDGRSAWTYSISPLLQPGWATEQGITAIGPYVKAIGDIVGHAIGNGCAGLKLPISYYRPIGIHRVSITEAERALAQVLKAPVAGYRFDPHRNPVYADPEVTASLWRYQDYLLREVMLQAGQLDTPVQIHIAVGVQPGLRLDYNDPRSLYELFTDRDITAAGTRFVLLHAAYPQHQYVAAFLSQFPHVFADLSFFTHSPGALEEILRSFLAAAPSDKILHGSDWSAPEDIGYAVDTTRRVLARVLGDYRSIYGWSPADVERMATDVLGGSARRIFRIPNSTGSTAPRTMKVVP